MLAQDVHPKVVQEVLGHSQIALTLDTYSHLIPGLAEDAAAKMDAALLFDPETKLVGVKVGVKQAEPHPIKAATA